MFSMYYAVRKCCIVMLVASSNLLYDEVPACRCSTVVPYKIV